MGVVAPAPFHAGFREGERPWHNHCWAETRMLSAKVLWSVVALIGLAVLALSAIVIVISTSPR